MASKLFLGRRNSDDSDVLHKTDRLTRHGVVIGMTGSGKTGLAITMLEELVLSGVPIIALDPKGDLTNLALVFPELAPADFAPWVDPGEAQRDGITPAALAEKRAALWKKGLGKWDTPPARMAELRDKMALRIYTPGSRSGRPVDVLAALSSPPPEALSDPDARASLVGGTVAALLSLVGVKADPVRSPEHLGCAQIIDMAWSAGEDLNLEMLILRIVDPPFKKVGVFPVDRFWKPDDRMDLAMRLNGVIASPSFAGWMAGEPLDPGAMLEPRDGKVPVSVFHMARLTDSERFFFAALLLERLVAWSRAQSGTSSLRALLYLDEAFGYLPPHPANPPTKKPLLTLMKQARAVGVGVLLATQNPVDLDYKALTNAGSWFIGRLSTENDVKRVAEGLRQAGTGGEDPSDAIGGLQPREFLLRDVSEDAPILFRSRWAMSFLRGPVTPDELHKLPNIEQSPASGGSAQTQQGTASSVNSGSSAAQHSAARGASQAGQHQATPTQSVPQTGSAQSSNLPGVPVAPATPAGGVTWFLDPRAVFSARQDGAFDRYAEDPLPGGAVLYRPAMYARLKLRFDEERVGYVLDEEHRRVWFPLDGVRRPDEPLSIELDARDLLSVAPKGARFDLLPEWLDEDKEWRAAKKELVDSTYREQSRGQFVCPPLKLHGKAGESRDDFEERCREAIEDLVDNKLAKLSDRFETKIDRVRERIRKKEAQVDQLEDKSKAQKTAELLNAGEMLAGFFFGKKRRRSLSGVATKRRQASAAAGRLDAAEGDLVALADDLEELEAELVLQKEAIEDEGLEALDAITEKDVRLEKNDIAVEEFGVLWVPVTRRV